MSKEMIQLLMQFITALVAQQVNRKGNEAALQGFVSLDEAQEQAVEDDSNVEIAKQQLATHLGCSVADLSV